jgi:regulator of sirC expression with transglutaminase-like and TPR domain
MPNPEQLPHLMRLLDDDSPIVQESVANELTTFGPGLERELARLNIALSEQQQKLMTGLLEGYKRKWLRESWRIWTDVEDEKQKLEKALSLIAEFQYGPSYDVKVAPLLDQLASEFSQKFSHGGVRELANYLFRIKAIHGAMPEDYYNPLNSNLVYVIEQKRGIPISLACIYILVGRRLGFDIEGINFPGHFLARAKVGKSTFIVDCFGGGRFLEERELARLNTPSPISVKDILRLECDSKTIVGRILRNLINAYKQENNESSMRLMTELLESLDPEPDEG